MPKSSCVAVCVSFQRTMLEELCEVVNEYEKRLRETPFLPRSSYGCPMLREDGGLNRNFLMFVFCVQDFAMQYLKDVGLFWSKVQCNTFGRDMTCSAEPSIPERFRWRFRTTVAGAMCSESRSIKHGSLFQQSHLTFHRILLITYDIVCCESAHHIQKEYVVLALHRHLLQVRVCLYRLLYCHFCYVVPPRWRPC